MQPLVTCLLPTYNKFASDTFGDCTHLIEESIESFLRQDYANKELLLVNDCPGQTYACDAPGVTVINLPRRFRSLGEKLNFMAGLAKGELLFRWDDDDIYFPWRMSKQVELLEQYSYAVVSHAWWYMQQGYSFNENRGFSHAAFHRELFAELRGFAFKGVGEDLDFENRVLEYDSAKFICLPVTEENCFVLNRWSTGSQHVSSYDGRGYEVMGRTRTRVGHKVLRPRWRSNYVDEVRNLCKTNTEFDSTAHREILWPQRR